MERLPDPSGTTTRLAGRRLVRRLGEGREWTAYSTVLADADATGCGSRADRRGPSSDAVLLRARADAAERSLWRRAAILSRLDHPHIVRLVDVAEDPNGLPCLLVERLAGGTLGELLRRRESIAPGEAVTILAPLVDAVRAAHLSGIGHGGIGASAVRFADDGRPVLTGWSRAAPVDHQSPVGGLGRTAPAFAADWAAFAELMDGVLQATNPDGAPSTTAWADELVMELADHEFANRLQQRIHALARPLPVLLDRVDPPSASPAEAIRASADRGQRTTPALPTRRATIESRRRSRPVARLRRRLPWRPSRGGPAVADRPAPAVDVRPRRRRLVIGAAGAAAVLVSAAMVFLPSEGASTAIAPTPSDSPVAVSEPTTSPTPAEETSTPPTDQAGAVDAVTGDDPVAAARELVSRRDRCQASGEQGCVWDSVERGSPFDDDERLGIGIGSIDAASLDLVDRQGDAVVLRGTAEPPAGDETAAGRRQPVTLLVVRGETGWRLREVFTAG